MNDQSSVRRGRKEASSNAPEEDEALARLFAATEGSKGATKGTLIMAVILAAFGIFWMIAATQIPDRTKIGSLGPGFLPFWAGLILTGVSGTLAVVTLRARRREGAGKKQAVEQAPPQLWRVYGALAALFLYIVLLTHLHFFINTAIISAIGLVLGGEPLRPRLLLYTLIITSIIYGLFVAWLQVPLPGSLIGT